MDITVTLDPEEVLVIAVLMATAFEAPDEVVSVMERIAGKIMDAQDALETVGI